MEDFLMNIDVTSHMMYLALILFVIGKGLKEAPFIQNWIIIWILMAISLIINFVFFGITFESLFESMISTSLAIALHQTCKQTTEGFKLLRKI